MKIAQVEIKKKEYTFSATSIFVFNKSQNIFDFDISLFLRMYEISDSPGNLKLKQYLSIVCPRRD